MTDLQTVREALEIGREWVRSTAHRTDLNGFIRQNAEKKLEVIEAALEVTSRLEAAAVPELSREDVVRLAREAGLYVGTNLSGVALVGAEKLEHGLLVHLSVDDLQRFAALVRSNCPEIPDSSPAPQEGWRPIETAPKDGTLVLLWCEVPPDRKYASPKTRFCIGFYGDDGGVASHNDDWYSIESEEEMWGMGGELTGPMFDTKCLRCKPIHWMPLPAAPQPGDKP